MKILLPFAFLILFLSNNTYANHNKYALIIAIGDYPRESGWGTINSKNDVPLIKETLINQGFSEENISYLFEKDGTIEGVTKAINELINKASKGDYIVIHYSGHGQQISDNNGDEFDGLDEALVMYNAPAYGGDGYNGENHLRDEDFGRLINQLRAKTGKDGQVIVILDSCHSGTSTRGENKVRGDKKPLILETSVPKNKDTKKETDLGLLEVPTSRGAEKDMAPFVLFSGAKADESNYEYNGTGSLSYAISQAFTKVDSTSTFSSVFADILSIMANIAPNQTPEIEGDINNKVFNGGVVKQEPYYTTNEIINENNIKINGGLITGVNIGDVVAIYKSGTYSIDNKKEMTKGKVTSTANFTAQVELDDKINIENVTDIWAFVVEKNLNNIKVNVKLKNIKNKEIEDELLSAINYSNTATISSGTPDIVISQPIKKPTGKQTIDVNTYGEGIHIGEINAEGDISRQFSSIIENYSRGKFFRQLELEDENYKITIELIPVIPELDKYGRVKKDDNNLYIIKDTLDINNCLDNGLLKVSKNDYFIIKVNNIGDKDAYFNIIDIQPDGVINALLPDQSHKIRIDELMLEAGKSKIVPGFIIAGFYPPYGKEVFKVISSDKPIDMSPVITSRGADNTKGELTELGKIVTSTYRTRGAHYEISTIKSKGNGSTINYTFEIVED